MAGRHARQHDRRRPLLVASAIGLALIVGGGVTWMVNAPTPRPATVASELRAAPSAPSSTAATSDPSTPPAALTACAGSITAGTSVVDSAGPAFDHWSRHVQAQNDYAAGTIDRERVLAVWAETKATGVEDVAAFDRAEAGFAPVSTACTALPTAGMSARWQAVAAECGGRATALATAVSAGDAVVADWRHHVEMMEAKPHTDPTAYGQMWRDMVAAAPPNLTAFAAARDALNQQPACPVPA